MVIDTVSLLRELDFTITEGSMTGTWMLGAPDGSRFEVTPMPATERLDSRTLRRSIAHRDVRSLPLLVGRTATAAVLDRARSGEADVLTAEPTRIIHAGIEREVPVPQRIPPRRGTPGRPAWGRWAVERYLLLAKRPARQAEIAGVLGISQQAVSQAVAHLGSLVVDHGDGLRVRDRRSLLDRWLEEYAGPGGLEFGWYSLGPVGEQVAVMPPCRATWIGCA